MKVLAYGTLINQSCHNELSEALYLLTNLLHLLSRMTVGNSKTKNFWQSLTIAMLSVLNDGSDPQQNLAIW